MQNCVVAALSCALCRVAGGLMTQDAEGFLVLDHNADMVRGAEKVMAFAKVRKGRPGYCCRLALQLPKFYWQTAHPADALIPATPAPRQNPAVAQQLTAQSHRCCRASSTSCRLQPYDAVRMWLPGLCCRLCCAVQRPSRCRTTGCRPPCALAFTRAPSLPASSAQSCPNSASSVSPCCHQVPCSWDMHCVLHSNTTLSPPRDAGDTMNTASRMESTCKPGEVKVAGMLPPAGNAGRGHYHVC